MHHLGAASTEIGDLLPHIKSQGAIDLEYESDGETCNSSSTLSVCSLIS